MNQREWKEVFLYEHLPKAVSRGDSIVHPSFVIDDSTEVHEPSVEGFADVAEYRRANYNAYEGKVPAGLISLRPQDHPLLNGREA